jgi:hypothetical protein
LANFLGIGHDQLAACKAKLCQSQFGQLMNNALAPVGALTGGLLGGCCPVNNPLALAGQPANGAEGVAADIKKEEADAAARRAAVRYLGTVDCNWFPKAQDALIDALRNDPNECVRLEAAWALARGCCCTPKTMEALTETIKGGKKIGFAPENSERVKDVAAMALERCQACFPQTTTPELQKKGTPDLPGQRPEGSPKVPPDVPKGSGTGTTQTKVTAAAGEVTMAEALEHARAALAERAQRPTPAVVPVTARRGDHSLVGIFSSARRAPAATQMSGQMVASNVPVTTEPVAAGQPIIDAAPAVQQVSFSTTVPAGKPSMDAKMQEWVKTLTSSRHAEMREFAAKNLGACDGYANPYVAQALLNASYRDSSVTVRVACIKAMVKMNLSVPPVVETLKVLKSDKNANVRDEATQALAKLAPGQD